MRFCFSTMLLIATALVSGGANAAAPLKPRADRYQSLWLDSDFTTKPPTTSEPAINPLGDWALGGISEVNGGHYLLLIHRKANNQMEVIQPGVASSFQILKVERDASDYLQTRVQLSYQGQTGWVSYDSALISRKAVTNPAPTSATSHIPVPTQTQPSALRARMTVPTSR